MKLFIRLYLAACAYLGITVLLSAFGGSLLSAMLLGPGRFNPVLCLPFVLVVAVIITQVVQTHWAAGYTLGYRHGDEAGHHRAYAVGIEDGKWRSQNTLLESEKEK